MTKIASTMLRSIQILSQAFDSWVVEFRIEVSELLDNEKLLTHLRSVKQAISEAQTIPESCLLFDGIVRKTQVEDWVDVVVRIKKRIIASGAPQVTFLNETSNSGDTYANMHALLDIFFLDEFGQVISLEKVLRSIRMAGVSMEYVDQDTIAAKLIEVIDSQVACKGMSIAKGQLPEIGKDAELEFFFQAVCDSTDIDLLYSSRRVRNGDLLCRKTRPSDGLKPGYNVLGQELPPKVGSDIKLCPGVNTVLSLDDVDVVASCEGVVVITRSTRKIRISKGIKEVPESVSIRVDPILKLDGTKKIDIVTNQAVEISGNLCVGSRILSESEVFVAGDVEDGASITAVDDIVVKGNIYNATLSSQRNIAAGQSAQGASIHAYGDVTVNGEIRNSSISGDSVTARVTNGSKITARKSITIDQIDQDEGKLISTISVGMNDFFAQRLRENQIFLEAAYTNLERIKAVIGQDIYDNINRSNLQSMLMKVLSRLHLDASAEGRKKASVYRKLIESIPSTQAIVAQKERETIEITRRMREQNSESEAMIIVKERVSGKTITSVNGVRETVESSERGIKIKNSDENSEN